MQTWEILERAVAPDGAKLVLARRGDEWVVRAGGHVLMSSRAHGSEEALAAAVLERMAAPRPEAAPRSVLIGGLGLGFTLRAALDRLPAAARVVVAELVPELVAWNRTHVAGLAGRPLDDPRCEVKPGDVAALLAEPAAFDAILLDVDNGPSALAHPANARLYGEAGVRACWQALRPGGVLGLWSASRDERYAARLVQQGFAVEVKPVAERLGARSADVLFIASKARPAQRRQR